MLSDLTEHEIKRSLHVDPTSKTPYSDATKVRGRSFIVLAIKKGSWSRKIEGATLLPESEILHKPHPILLIRTVHFFIGWHVNFGHKIVNGHNS